jgi:hypothetical protein
MNPTMARLTVARKIATITWMVWKKGVCFDAAPLKRQVTVGTSRPKESAPDAGIMPGDAPSDS